MKFKIALLIIFIYCITLVVKLPAAAVVDWLPRNVAKVNNVTGTIWHGQAQSISINTKTKFENVQWDIKPMSLLSLTLEAAVSFNNGPDAMSGKGVVAYNMSGVSASNVILDMTSEQLMHYLPRRLPGTLQGDFSVVIKEFKQGQPYCQQLEGNILWQNAKTLSQYGDINLGQPTADLGCTQGNVTAFVSQESDQLVTNLDIVLGKNAIYELNGEIQGTDKLAPKIADALNWIGPKNAAGATTLTYTGKL